MKSYPGHKKINGVFHKIINEIPVHKVYYELFAGTAAIAKLIKGTGVKLVLNDIDRSVTDKLNCIPGITATITTIPATNILEKLIKSAAGTDVFVFLDPPYLHSTRPNSTKLYKYEMVDREHIQLLSTALQLKCNCMIIHPKCELYDNMLSSWRKVEIKVRYHGKTSIECLYMNYGAPDALQSDLYLGKDCWDRQRIKRKAERIVDKFDRLPVLERNYVLKLLKEKY
ncbi:MAG: DNA adenine methylase [Bacteroidia bacterium]